MVHNFQIYQQSFKIIFYQISKFISGGNLEAVVKEGWKDDDHGDVVALVMATIYY